MTMKNVDDLIARIKNSADRLAADGPARGDLKILSRTLRELRYAFKVFAPYRNCLLYTSPSPRDRTRSRMPSSA